MTEPDEKMYRADVAALLGIHTDSLARLPAEDGRDIDGRHARPWWHRSTIEAWRATRPGQGKRTDLANKVTWGN